MSVPRTSAPLGMPFLFMTNDRPASSERPADGGVGAKNDDALIATRNSDALGRAKRCGSQRDALVIRSQAIKLRTVQGREGFQAVQRVFLGENLGIDLQSDRR